MDRYLVISSDTHAGPPSEAYRDYVDPQHRAALENLGDVHLALAIAARARAASGARGDTTGLQRKLRLAREIQPAAAPRAPG